jgi:hypothetical protein
MGSSRLSPLQTEILEGFFARPSGFFLTGGAALAGFLLHHRETKDLDLFAPATEDIREATRIILAVASDAGAETRILRESADFRRLAVTRGAEITLVDLVIDRAPQAHAEKITVGSIRLDPPAEIAANKLCTLLDRAEPRDLVDLKLLLESGLSLESVLADAQKKHAGADPAALAFALSQAVVAPPAALPEGVDPRQLDAFRERLVHDLARLALPT